MQGGFDNSWKIVLIAGIMGHENPLESGSAFVRVACRVTVGEQGLAIIDETLLCVLSTWECWAWFERWIVLSLDVAVFELVLVKMQSFLSVCWKGIVWAVIVVSLHDVVVLLAIGIALVTASVISSSEEIQRLLNNVRA